MRGVKYPHEWLGSSDEQKVKWAAEGDKMLAAESAVPKNSLQSFAIAWRYVCEVKSARKPRQTKPITDTARAVNNPAEAAVT